jgi:hypothetical protein
VGIRWLLAAAGVAFVAAPGAGGGDTARAPEPSQAQREEIERGEALELEIQEELRRQEELLERIDAETPPPRSASEPALSDRSLSERADPRVAPTAPKDRDLPMAIFEKQRVTIPEGSWGNQRVLDVIQRSLDADRDGKPEQIRYFDAKTGVMIRKEQDGDYDGSFDTWNSYQGGQLVARALDTNGDGTPDAWERYASGRMTSREVDRDYDGVKDAFYRFEANSLAEERHDSDNDGKVDLTVSYEQRRRVSTEEDRDRDGRVDTWTTYRGASGAEVIVRIERDTQGRDKPDVFETFQAVDGKPVLSKREEDVNGDGKIDVTSIYQHGKLIRRQISDPSLVPL